MHCLARRLPAPASAPIAARGAKKPRQGAARPAAISPFMPPLFRRPLSAAPFPPPPFRRPFPAALFRGLPTAVYTRPPGRRALPGFTRDACRPPASDPVMQASTAPYINRCRPPASDPAGEETVAGVVHGGRRGRHCTGRLHTARRLAAAEAGPTQQQGKPGRGRPGRRRGSPCRPRRCCRGSPGTPPAHQVMPWPDHAMV